MSNELRQIWGLDHKCRTCGGDMVDHAPQTYECSVAEGADPDPLRHYNPKGPKVPLLFRRYLQDFEDAALNLRVAQVADSYQGSLEHTATFIRAKDEYKHARFVLNAYIQNIVGDGDDDGSK